MKYIRQRSLALHSSASKNVIGDHLIPTSTDDENSNAVLKWDVYVSMSKQCQTLGSVATLAAFKGLAPSDLVTVHAVESITMPPTSSMALSNSKSTSRGGQSSSIGPRVRCIQTDTNLAIDVGSCDSVEKVFRVLSVHMGLETYIDPSACECLKWNYKGNSHLDQISNSSSENEKHVNAAIRAYNKALATGYRPQEGVLLVMRATAYLQRAFEHRKKLKEVVNSLLRKVPDPVSIQGFYELALQNPWAAPIMFEKMKEDTEAQDAIFMRLKFQSGLYEYALLHAAQDSLRSTQLLPQYAKTWLRSGDSLAELRKLRESTYYYEKALELDPTLEESLRPTIERLKKSQEFLDRARANGWSEDTLRVSLDVAG